MDEQRSQRSLSVRMCVLEQYINARFETYSRPRSRNSKNRSTMTETWHSPSCQASPSIFQITFPEIDWTHENEPTRPERDHTNPLTPRFSHITLGRKNLHQRGCPGTPPTPEFDTQLAHSNVRTIQLKSTDESQRPLLTTQ